MRSHISFARMTNKQNQIYAFGCQSAQLAMVAIGIPRSSPHDLLIVSISHIPCCFRTFFINGKYFDRVSDARVVFPHSPVAFAFFFIPFWQCRQMCYKFVEKRSMCHWISPAANFNDCIFDGHRSMKMQHSSNAAPYIHSQLFIAILSNWHLICVFYCLYRMYLTNRSLSFHL